MWLFLLVLFCSLVIIIYSIYYNKVKNEHYDKSKICQWVTDDDEHYVTDCGKNHRCTDTYKPVFQCKYCHKNIKHKYIGKE